MALAYQPALPQPYPNLSDQELTESILRVRHMLGKKLVILAHHYQRPEIVRLSDVRGDSLQLAQFAVKHHEADWIVFCGVHFMAEGADLLKARPDQTVILPDLGAGCDMADMADIEDVEQAWEQLTDVFQGEIDVLPITYINSTAALKAFVAQKGGVVCTSSNAERMMRWAFQQKKTLFFFPDQFLGKNTALKMGLDPSALHLWNPKKRLGGLTREALLSSKVLLWQGHCPVHAMFSLRQIETLKAKDPGFQVIVHPECAVEVVAQADCSGSTDFIVKTIAASSAGSKWAVGTELNLVNRIAEENPDKTVVSLNPFMCLCGTMNRIDLPHLAWALDAIVEGRPQNVITVKDPIRSLAQQALFRMLELSSSSVTLNTNKG